MNFTQAMPARYSISTTSSMVGGDFKPAGLGHRDWQGLQLWINLTMRRNSHDFAVASLFVLLASLATQAAAAPKPDAKCLDRATARAAAVQADHERAVLSSAKLTDPVARTKATLSAMMAADQQIREVVMLVEGSCHVALGEADTPQIMTSGRAIGERTRDELKRILKASGWPIISVYGKEADKAAFLIAQHADRDPALQSQVLAILEPLVATQETDGENFALLYDRVQVNASKPQRYGSQGECKGHRWVPEPIEAPAEVDRRRAGLGLEPMKSYQAKVSKLYCGR
jgi:hypothetical protein